MLVAMVVVSQLLTLNGALLRLRASAMASVATRDDLRYHMTMNLAPLQLDVCTVNFAFLLGRSRDINLGSAYFLSASVLFMLGWFFLRLGRPAWAA